MKALYAILIILIATLFLSGCTSKPQNTTNEPGNDSAVSETGGTANEAQTMPEVLSGEEPVKPYYPLKNAGSAKELVGDNLIVSIFLEDDESPIDAQAEAEILKHTREAADWLEAEAKRRDKTIQIITGKDSSELVLRHKYSGTITDLNYDDILLIMKEMKMGSYYSKIKEKYGDDINVTIGLFLNKANRSWACPNGLAEPTEDMLLDISEPVDFGYLDIFICYKYQNTYDIPYNPTPYDPYVIAHELLHLYGAIDLYYESSDEPQYDAMKADKSIIVGTYFPNDIMFTHNEPNEISDLTAYLIGWEETVPIKYTYFLYEPYATTGPVF